jgi:hypothetical protein
MYLLKKCLLCNFKKTIKIGYICEVQYVELRRPWSLGSQWFG